MRMLGLMLSLFCISCVANEGSVGETTDSTDVQNYKLTIINEGMSCMLSFEGFSAEGQIEFSPKPPCYFLRRESNEPQVFSYQDVGVKATLIVVGTPISEKTRKEWGLSNDLYCGEEAQGILIKDKSIELSASVLSGGVWCKDKGADEKDFWFFAHENGLKEH